ncbi:hypothetical protein ACFWSF_17320 [Streptomyces sp. NPDC058611]|uniref:hypothetical protein n=1 Tax=unclassified Streptomyces TaxID=2593676 RepID=UPI0036547E8B
MSFSQSSRRGPAGSQGSHHWVLTLELPGRSASTSHGTWTPPAGMTRYDAYQALRSSMVAEQPELSRANTTYFSLEPNQL